jgi:hypothetical protein
MRARSPRQRGNRWAWRAWVASAARRAAPRRPGRRQGKQPRDGEIAHRPPLLGRAEDLYPSYGTLVPPWRSAKGQFVSRSGARADTAPAPPTGPLTPRRVLEAERLLAWASAPATVRGACCRSTPIGLAMPGRPTRSLVAEDRSARGVHDRTGPEPAGTRWVHAEPADRGV